MKRDTGSRSFVTIVGACSVAWVAVALAACVLITLLTYRISLDGFAVVTASGHNVRPALVFLLFVATGAALGLWSVGTQLASSLRLGRRVRALTVPVPPALIAASKQAHLACRIRMVDSDDSFCFTYGALRPRVAVSRGLLEAASERELGAVLEHERYHVVKLDPLKIMLVRALLAAFFFIPALRDLQARYMAGRELAADRRAVAAHGRPPLAGALLKVIRGPSWQELQTAAAIGEDLLDVRIAQLESGREPSMMRISALSLFLSALGVALLSWSFVATVDDFGGLGAVLRATMPGTDLSASSLALSVLCPAPVVVAAAAVYGWLSWRAGRETPL